MKQILLMIVFISVNFIFCNSLFAKDTKKTETENEVEPIVQPNRAVPGIINVHSLGFGVGETFLHGDFKDNGDNIITGDLFYSYSASYSFDAVANVHYSEHKYKGRSVRIPGATFSIKAKVFQFDSFSPFVMAGLGFYRPVVVRMMNNALTRSDAKWTFGPNLGIGADLRLNRHFIAGVLIQYHNPFDVKQDVGEPVSGYYTKLLMTLMYSF